MLKKIVLALAVVLVAFLAFAATRPDAFRVERSAEMAAPPEGVYALVADFHQWQTWSPWDKRDPAMVRTYGGPPSGPGATYSWKGNRDVGEGRMTVIGATPAKSVDIKLEFLEPFPATNATGFTFEPSGAGTRVTWSMAGKNNFMGKVMSVFFDMDTMVGKDFEVGLANMKGVAEAEAKTPKAAAVEPAPPSDVTH